MDIMNLRDQIITTARELFMKQGYVATSTRQIAAILNVSQPAIYHHFKNKEAIFIIVISQFALEIGSHLRLIEEKTQRDRLLAMALYLRESHEMNFSLMMNDLQHAISDETNHKIFSIWFENYFKPFIDFFNSIESYLLPHYNVSTVSQHFLRILSSYISESYTNENLDKVSIEDMVDIFLRGITGHNFENLI